MHNFEIIVQFGTNTVEFGYCDADHISIITLLHCMSKKTTGKEDVPKEQFCVFVILPWCNDVVEVKNDNELVNIFSMFREHGCNRIVFEIDYQTYVPLPPEGSSFTPNAVDPEVFIDEYEGLDVDDLDENYFTYHGDDEEGGSVNGEEGGIAHNGNANSQVVVDHRAKTFLQLLEFIRRMVMKRFQKRKEECLGWKIEIPPSVSKKILMASKNSRILRMLSAGNGEYELLDERRAYVVKINQATCECGGWQVSGIPCCHAMAAISHYAGRDGVTRRIVEYVHPKLTKTAFSHTYSTMIHPIPDICVWPNLNTTPLIPPPFRTKPGRPKLRRRREPGEKPKEGRSRSVACNKCGQPGHNKRTCRNEPVFGRKKQV
ncbi:hypothetical protein ACOSQ4_022450 [Xanthoceras sorbifolium]